MRRPGAALARGGLAPLRCETLISKKMGDSRLKRRQDAAGQSADKAAHSKEGLDNS